MSISGVPSAAPIAPARPIQPTPARAADPDGDGDNDATASAASESREASSTHEVDIRV